MQDDKTFATRLNSRLENASGPKVLRVELFFQGKLFSVETSDLPFYLGRDETACDFVVVDSTISRRHCVLQLRGQQIGLLDTSTNGTFVQAGRSNPLQIHNEFYPLSGKGTLRMGRTIEADDPELIHFKVVTEA